MPRGKILARAAGKHDHSAPLSFTASSALPVVKRCTVAGTALTGVEKRYFGFRGHVRTASAVGGYAAQGKENSGRGF